MRFLVDENIPVEIVEYLRNLGHDVLDVAASEHRGATDTNLWHVATAENRVIITHHRDFPVLGQDALPPALILVRPQNNLPAAVLELFRSFWEQVAEEDVSGHVYSVQPARHRRRRLR